MDQTQQKIYPLRRSLPDIAFVQYVFLGTNYGEILSRYFNEGEEYLKSVNETNHLSGEYHQEVTGLFSLTADYFQDLKAIYGFDYHMAHGTMIADYLVPIIAIFAGLNLHKRLRSTFALSAFRKEITVRH
ncbi:MAG: hypothetical protein V8T10_06065 [Merdibacter sp.]